MKMALYLCDLSLINPQLQSYRENIRQIPTVGILINTQPILPKTVRAVKTTRDVWESTKAKRIVERYDDYRWYSG